MYVASWQEDLQKHIAPEQLPEFYGGVCRDSNSDPKCSEHVGVYTVHYLNIIIKADGMDSQTSGQTDRQTNVDFSYNGKKHSPTNAGNDECHCQNYLLPSHMIIL